jgi:hypothetical protein
MVNVGAAADDVTVVDALADGALVLGQSVEVEGQQSGSDGKQAAMRLMAAAVKRNPSVDGFIVFSFRALGFGEELAV